MISGIKLKISGMSNKSVKVCINSRRLPEMRFYRLRKQSNDCDNKRARIYQNAPRTDFTNKLI